MRGRVGERVMNGNARRMAINCCQGCVTGWPANQRIGKGNSAGGRAKEILRHHRGQVGEFVTPEDSSIATPENQAGPMVKCTAHDIGGAKTVWRSAGCDPKKSGN